MVGMDAIDTHGAFVQGAYLPICHFDILTVTRCVCCRSCGLFTTLLFIKVDIVLLDVYDRLAEEGIGFADKVGRDLDVDSFGIDTSNCNYRSLTSALQLALAIASLSRIILSS
jgi:hypothetical protein